MKPVPPVKSTDPQFMNKFKIMSNIVGNHLSRINGKVIYHKLFF